MAISMKEHVFFSKGRKPESVKALAFLVAVALCNLLVVPSV